MLQAPPGAASSLFLRCYKCPSCLVRQLRSTVRSSSTASAQAESSNDVSNPNGQGHASAPRPDGRIHPNGDGTLSRPLTRRPAPLGLRGLGIHETYSQRQPKPRGRPSQDVPTSARIRRIKGRLRIRALHVPFAVKRVLSSKKASPVRIPVRARHSELGGPQPIDAISLYRSFGEVGFNGSAPVEQPRQRRREPSAAALNGVEKTQAAEVGRRTLVRERVKPSVSASREVEKTLAAELRKRLPAREQMKKLAPGETDFLATKGVKNIAPGNLELIPLASANQPPVPRLRHGLDRVLFNPGVYQLQDPRTRVFNFDPYLHKILPVDQFNFKALQEYETSSKDKRLGEMADECRMRYYGSTSSMTGMLRHFHFLLSQGRKLNFSMLTQAFDVNSGNYSNIAKVPAAVFLRYKQEGGRAKYAIDADKYFGNTNVMSLLGHSLEKLLTSSVSEFEEYRIQKDRAPVAPSEPPRNSYNYTAMGDMLMRAQLDSCDPRLPGTGIFDIKTRAVVSVRAHAFSQDHRPGLGYEIKQEHGQWESFEREQYDMLRTTMLGYSLQARMGRMDGIFAAYHNIERIFGFQYLGLEDLDLGLHGQRDRILGDQEFKISLGLLKEIFDLVTEKFPKQSIRLHMEARSSPTVLYIFAEPMTEEEVEVIQTRNDERNARITHSLLYPDASDEAEPERGDADAWAELRAHVEDDIARGQSDDAAESSDSTSETDNHEGQAQLHIEHRLLGLQSDTEAIKARVKEHIQSAGRTDDEPSTASATDVQVTIAQLEEARKTVSTVAEQIEKEQGQGSKLLKLVGHVREFLEEQQLALTELIPNEGSEGDRNAAQQVLEGHSGSAGPSTETTEEADTDNTAMGPTVRESYSDNTAAASTEDAVASSFSAVDENKPLLALTLAVRNKVNGLHVRRPEQLKASDEWTVDYVLDEVSSGQQAWALYEGCKGRRRVILEGDGKAAAGMRRFREEVQAWALKGKEWRVEREREEQEKGIELFEAFDKGE